MWNIALYAYLFVFSTCSALSIFRKSNRKGFTKPVEDFLIASEDLKPGAVVSLLLSTSFGLNYLFYQIWVGYTVGAWGLVTQGAWVIGMILLSKYSEVIKGSHSLHEFLGKKFDREGTSFLYSARFWASICSIVGMLFMMGWEAGIGVDSFAKIFSLEPSSAVTTSQYSPSLIVGLVVFGSLFYTLIGGLKGNAYADILLNSLKIIITTAIAAILIYPFWKNNATIRFASFFPSPDVMKANLGIWALITSIIFSLVWQFVDNTTWQTVKAGAKGTDQAKSNLINSGIAAFIAPGIIGTLIGIGLLVNKKMDQTDIFRDILTLMPTVGKASLFIMFSLLMACIMSLVDGLFINSSYTIITDIVYPKRTMQDLNKHQNESLKILILVRVVLLLLGLLGFFGVRLIYSLLHLDLFDCFFVMMITQLAMFGPVIIGLSTNRIQRFPLYLAIILSLLVGFYFVYLGKSQNISWLIDGAGTFTIGVSLMLSILFTRSNKSA